MGKGKKVAFLVGVGTYGAGLKSLQCPLNGVRALTEILQTPDVGGFDDVVHLEDPDVGTFRARMGEVFSPLRKDDLALFYFTGHGIKDMMGEFYLTTAQTQLFENGRLNPGTAIEASFVKTLLGNCYAQRKVVVLDCCFGAAFADGFLTMDDGGMDVQADLGGEGWVVLTAATARNYALEQEGEPLSLYTRYLVEGLKTGAASPEGQDYITVGQLHTYVRGKVKTAAPTMEPAIFNARAGQEIALAKAVIHPELIYRQKVQTKIRRGRIAPAGRQFLNTWQTKLNLRAARAVEIEAEVLKPFAEKQRHLDLYAETLREEIEEEFPLCPEAIQDLKELQRLWNLGDVDVESVVREVLHAQDLDSPEWLTVLLEAKVPKLQYPSTVTDTCRQGGSPRGEPQPPLPGVGEAKITDPGLIDWLTQILLAGQPGQVQVRQRGNILHVLCETVTPLSEVKSLTRLVSAMIDFPQSADYPHLPPRSIISTHPDVYQLYMLYIYSRQQGDRQPRWTAPIYLNRLERHKASLQQKAQDL
jgi:hypothetical protein